MALTKQTNKPRYEGLHSQAHQHVRDESVACVRAIQGYSEEHLDISTLSHEKIQSDYAQFLYLWASLRMQNRVSAMDKNP